MRLHIYANPYCVPIFCPTFFAKYLAAFETKEEEILFYFKSYTKFWKILKEIFRKHQNEVEILGGKMDDIGVPYIRKWTETYCCICTTYDPQIVSICYRVGWNIRVVKDTYILY